MCDDLKSCPLCGASVKLVQTDEVEWKIVCTGCHAETSPTGYLRELKEEWNARPDPVKRKPALKTCPICGTHAYLYKNNGKYAVRCAYDWVCGFETLPMETPQEAADFWNREVKNG